MRAIVIHRAALLVLLLLPVSLCSGSLVTSEPPSRERLAENADVVFVGEAAWIDEENLPSYRLYVFEVSEYLKNPLPSDTVSIKCRGGTLGNVTVELSPPDPTFELGTSYLMYAYENEGYYDVVYGFWGKTPITALKEGLLEEIKGEFTGSARRSNFLGNPPTVVFKIVPRGVTAQTMPVLFLTGILLLALVLRLVYGGELGN